MLDRPRLALLGDDFETVVVMAREHRRKEDIEFHQSPSSVPLIADAEFPKRPTQTWTLDEQKRRCQRQYTKIETASDRVLAVVPRRIRACYYSRILLQESRTHLLRSMPSSLASSARLSASGNGLVSISAVRTRTSVDP